MSSTTDMNIVLGQANAIKKVHDVTKQNLELNQQFVARNAEGKKRENKTKVKKSESGDKVDIEVDEEKEQNNPEDGKEHSKKKGEEDLSQEGYFIDIKV